MDSFSAKQTGQNACYFIRGNSAKFFTLPAYHDKISRQTAVNAVAFVCTHRK